MLKYDEFIEILIVRYKYCVLNIVDIKVYKANNLSMNKLNNDTEKERTRNICEFRG